MTDTRTPGQLAYETYVLHLYGDDQFPWPTLLPDAKAAWDAAAQAVLAWQTQEGRLRRWTPQPLHATREDTP
jgi:hypothetical protein